MLRVAIDGPGGTGKSTIAKMVAEKLDLEYIDTGAMYRAIALKAIGASVPYTDEAAVADMLKTTEIDFRGGRIFLDGDDVSSDIRTNEISMGASNYSRISCVREKVNALNHMLATTRNVIMEGRDICTKVIPDAEVKIFMTASPEIRARRRYDQLIEAGKEADYDSIFREIQERDYQDSHRAISPLVKADDAILLDTSNMTIDENVQVIIDIVEGITRQ